MGKQIAGVVCVFSVLVMLVGCASIVGKSAYPVNINSKPDGADITIVDETGKTIHSGKTPTTVTLNTKAGYFKGKNYTVTFVKEGYAKHSAEIKRGVSGWYLAGNLLFGGLIGWFIVDPATGAMWTLPAEVNATLSQQTSSVPDKDSLNIITLDDVPMSVRSKMVKVN